MNNNSKVNLPADRQELKSKKRACINFVLRNS